MSTHWKCLSEVAEVLLLSTQSIIMFVWRIKMFVWRIKKNINTVRLIKVPYLEL